MSTGGKLTIRPITFRAACDFVDQHHRHHRRPQGAKFAVAVHLNDKVVGVATAGRPVSRRLDDGLTLEVTRVCTDGTPNAASKLYGAVKRVGQAMGYARFITYTLTEEPGTSLTAAGWTQTATGKGGSWDQPSRPRDDKHPTQKKRRWEAGGTETTG